MTDNHKNVNISRANNRPGIALLVVMILVVTISILSVGFAIKADTELLCGKNVEFRMDMDYLGLTSLNYARSLILNPQDVTTGAGEYWHGGSGLQVETGDDYFDIQVVRSVVGNTPESTFDISCQAYRLEDGVRISETKLKAQLRLDPCIAFYSRDKTDIPANMTVYGDVYCGNELTAYGNIKGDLFADSYVNSEGEVDGRFYDNNEEDDVTGEDVDVNVTWPGISTARFTPTYYIDTVKYWPVDLNSDYSDKTWNPSAGNPAGIFYREGNLTISGDVKINGTLVVTGDLDIRSNLVVNSLKNYPAIIVAGNITMYGSGSLTATGLVQTDKMEIHDDDALDVNITGGLYIENLGLNVSAGYGGKITVRGDPMAAMIKIKSTSINMTEWTPIGGAYFKSIARDNSN